LFLILNKHPLHLRKGESCLVIEWGLWKEGDELRNDLMSLVTFFSDEQFRTSIAAAKNPTTWRTVERAVKDHGLTVLKIGVTLLAATL
jgi:hypothetical protein